MPILLLDVCATDAMGNLAGRRRRQSGVRGPDLSGPDLRPNTTYPSFLASAPGTTGLAGSLGPSAPQPPFPIALPCDFALR